MVDGLVAFKLVSSQDRDAIGAWVEGSADKQQCDGKMAAKLGRRLRPRKRARDFSAGWMDWPQDRTSNR
jgi:hypothetical protein